MWHLVFSPIVGPLCSSIFLFTGKSCVILFYHWHLDRQLKVAVVTATILALPKTFLLNFLLIIIFWSYSYNLFQSVHIYSRIYVLFVVMPELKIGFWPAFRYRGYPAIGKWEFPMTKCALSYRGQYKLNFKIFSCKKLVYWTHSTHRVVYGCVCGSLMNVSVLRECTEYHRAYEVQTQRQRLYSRWRLRRGRSS